MRLDLEPSTLQQPRQMIDAGLFLARRVEGRETNEVLSQGDAVDGHRPLPARMTAVVWRADRFSRQVTECERVVSEGTARQHPENRTLKIQNCTVNEHAMGRRHDGGAFVLAPPDRSRHPPTPVNTLR